MGDSPELELVQSWSIDTESLRGKVSPKVRAFAQKIAPAELGGREVLAVRIKPEQFLWSEGRLYVNNGVGFISLGRTDTYNLSTFLHR